MSLIRHRIAKLEQVAPPTRKPLSIIIEREIYEPGPDGPVFVGTAMAQRITWWPDGTTTSERFDE